MNKKYTLGIFALFAISLLGVGMVSAFGMGQGKMLGFDEEERLEMKAFGDAIQNTLDNDDYSGWRTLMESQLTEEHFNQMKERYTNRGELGEHRAQMQEAFESGDFEGMNGLQKAKGFEGFEKKQRNYRTVGGCPFAE